jgi:hypothetical protein
MFPCTQPLTIVFVSVTRDVARVLSSCTAYDCSLEMTLATWSASNGTEPSREHALQPVALLVLATVDQ